MAPLWRRGRGHAAGPRRDREHPPDVRAGRRSRRRRRGGAGAGTPGAGAAAGPRGEADPLTRTSATGAAQRAKQVSGEIRNVLFLVADEWRGDALGLAGHGCVRTPHLEALAADGVCFLRHFSQASPCGPARASLLTGTSLAKHGQATNNTPLAVGSPISRSRRATVGTCPRTSATPILPSIPRTGQPTASRGTSGSALDSSRSCRFCSQSGSTPGGGIWSRAAIRCRRGRALGSR
ncbi:MAG: hypothetical protein EXQ96_00215 [Alphaproteobacteria bacterium]|nr:hypothetical protein [Alphaproteobacteria bacterium]